MLTNYRLAWSNFRKSDDYKKFDNMLKTHGIGQLYLRSALLTAFQNGWNAAGGKVKIVKK